MSTLRIGTRGSQLALYQANAVASLLHERADVACEVVVIKTSGDRFSEAALSEIGGKGLFVKEIEDALLEGGVDLAVHSSKDMSVVLPCGLAIAAALPREDARDALVLPRGADGDRSDLAASFRAVVAQLGESPRIGTSSVRRVAQLIALVPGARFLPIRGNLDTRLRKIDNGDFEAIVLASAGLKRLGFAGRISATVPAEACVPAPGQGIIAVEVRDDDAQTRQLVAVLDDAETSAALAAERAVVRRLGGGCQMPIGAHAVIDGIAVTVTGVVISLDGTRAIRATAAGDLWSAEALGVKVGDRLLAEGASDILADVNRALAHGGDEPSR